MNMVAQMVHLHPRQKEALQAMASKKGSSLAAEVREAIDNYLEGVSEVEFQELDMLTRQAEQAIQEMLDLLEEDRKDHENFKKELERLRTTRSTSDE